MGSERSCHQRIAALVGGTKLRGPPAMLPAMTTPGTEQFESLLANRARIGFGVPVHTPRPSMSALYEFGGAFDGHHLLGGRRRRRRHDVRRRAGVPGAP